MQKQLTGLTAIAQSALVEIRKSRSGYVTQNYWLFGNALHRAHEMLERKEYLHWRKTISTDRPRLSVAWNVAKVYRSAAEASKHTIDEACADIRLASIRKPYAKRVNLLQRTQTIHQDVLDFQLSLPHCRHREEIDEAIDHLREIKATIDEIITSQQRIKIA